MNITNKEKSWVAFARSWKAEDVENSVKKINKSWNIFNLIEIIFNWKSKNHAMGRFGGGWNWKLGIQGSGRHWVISLFICSIHFKRIKK